MTQQLSIDAIADLDTTVGVGGYLYTREVGGPICIGIGIGIGIYIAQ